MAKKAYVGLIAVVILSAVFLVGYSLGAGQAASQIGSSYQDGFNAAHQKLIDTGVVARDQVVTQIAGQVASVSGDTIVIDVPQLVADPLADPAPTERTVKIGSDTKIAKIMPKTDKTAAADEAAYDAALKKFEASGAKGAPPVPPLPEQESAITASDIQVGDRVTVGAAGDILRAESIDALSIKVLTAASPAAAVTSPSPEIPPPAGSAQ